MLAGARGAGGRRADLGSRRLGGVRVRPLAGVIFGGLTGVAYAAYILVLRQSGRDGRPAAALRDATASCAVACAVAGLALGDLDLTPGWRATAWLVVLALGAQVLGWLLISASLTRLPAALTAITLTLQPVASRRVRGGHPGRVAVELADRRRGGHPRGGARGIDRSGVTSVAVAPEGRFPQRSELDDVSAEEQRHRPVGDHAQLAACERQLVEVIGAGEPPAGEPAQPDPPEHLGHALVAAECGGLSRASDSGTAAAACRVSRPPCCPPAVWPGAGRAGRWAGSVRPGVAALGTAATSPSAQTPGQAATRRYSSTGTRPRSSTGSPSRRRADWGARPPSTPGSRSGPRAVGQLDAVRVSRPQARAKVQLEAAPLELAGRVRAPDSRPARAGCWGATSTSSHRRGTSRSSG